MSDELRQLDAEVAERVMGWTRLRSVERPDLVIFLSPESRSSAYFSTRVADGVMVEATTGDEANAPKYSTDIGAAVHILDRFPFPATVDLRGNRFYFDGKTDNGWSAQINNPAGKKGYAVAATLPEAICRAALKAINEENK